MSHFQKRDSGGNGVQDQEGWVGENGGRVDRLREQSPIWSLIINMSIMGMRRMTDIKAAIGSCRKHKAGNGGRALLSHSSGAGATGQCRTQHGHGV